MVRKLQRYVFVDRNEVLAVGTAQELAKELNTTVDTIYNHRVRTKAGATTFKHVYLEKEIPAGLVKQVKDRKLKNRYERQALRDKRVFAIYEGEKFVDVGTACELIKRNKITAMSFYDKVSKSKLGKLKNNVVIQVEN